MLSDPLSVTYNSVAKSLPRVSSNPRNVAQITGTSTYATADGEFTVRTVRSRLGGGLGTRVEISLARRVPDPDSDPFTGTTSDRWTNVVGLSFEFNDAKYSTSTDVPLLQSALLSLVDSTLRSRLLGGEI